MNSPEERGWRWTRISISSYKDKNWFLLLMWKRVEDEVEDRVSFGLLFNVDCSSSFLSITHGFLLLQTYASSWMGCSFHCWFYCLLFFRDVPLFAHVYFVRFESLSSPDALTCCCLAFHDILLSLSLCIPFKTCRGRRDSRLLCWLTSWWSLRHETATPFLWPHLHRVVYSSGPGSLLLKTCSL